MPSLSASAQGLEMDRASNTQSAIVGQPSCLFRPPYGEYNTTTLDVAFQRRMAVWNWSVDTEDWKAEGSGAQMWIDRIVALAQAGGSQQHPVILMHDQPTGNPATVAALPQGPERHQQPRGNNFNDAAFRQQDGKMTLNKLIVAGRHAAHPGEAADPLRDPAPILPDEA